MSSFVKKLQNKSSDYKNRVAIFAAISITAIIVVVWMLVLKNRNTTEDVNRRSMSENLRPLMMIFGGAKTDFNEIRSNVKSTE
jgi:hypothetical protein